MARCWMKLGYDLVPWMILSVNANSKSTSVLCLKRQDAEVRQQTICCSLVRLGLAKPHLPELLQPKCLRTFMSPRAQHLSVPEIWLQS